MSKDFEQAAKRMKTCPNFTAMFMDGQAKQAKRKRSDYDRGVADACKDFASLIARDAGKPTRIQLNPNGTWKPLP